MTFDILWKIAAFVVALILLEWFTAWDKGAYWIHGPRLGRMRDKHDERES